MKLFYKIIYLTAFLMFLSINVYSQNLAIAGPTEVDSTKDINEHWEIILNSNLTNTSFSDITVKVKILVQSIPVGHSFDCCWAGQCYPPTRTDWDSPGTLLLTANTTTPNSTFYAHYYCQDKGSDPVEGTGKLKYVFFNVNDPTDKAEINATFTFSNGGSVSEILANPGIEVKHSDDNVLSIVSENIGNYKLDIFGLSGNSALSQSFNTSFTKNLNELSAGVYLFSITNSEGKKVSTGKILIK